MDFVSALEAVRNLNVKYGCYILSTVPWRNPSAWSDKVEWITKHLEDVIYKRWSSLTASIYARETKGRGYIILADFLECKHLAAKLV